jgi:hypothetical protein
MKKLLMSVAVFACVSPAYAGEIWWATAHYPDTGCVTGVADPKKEIFSTPADAFAHMQEYAKQHSTKNFLMTPFLRDHGDWVEVGTMRSWDGRPYREEDDLGVYAFYRSKKVCEKAAAAADDLVKAILGAAAKEHDETHPDLNKYRGK